MERGGQLSAVVGEVVTVAVGQFAYLCRTRQTSGYDHDHARGEDGGLCGLKDVYRYVRRPMGLRR
ncbi:MAG: hypothetical protein JXN60_07550 [Lentisphaerae bacterium]|nr:hypothetical protein [Lentisphaerota bacterium]